MERPCAWKKYTPQQIEELEELCRGYKHFLSENKTERLCVKAGIKMAEEAGYVDLETVIAEGRELKAGDKVYAANHGKDLMLVNLGTAPLEQGFNILGAHVDSPRLDLKQNPAFEAGDMAYLDTHYYGGVKSYHWVASPLALVGVICKKDGTTVDINIGDKADDPVFTISDLLIHLSSEQMSKPAKDAVDAEILDVIVGGRPVKFDEDDKDAPKEPVKQMFLDILKEQYGVEEEDFLSAEIEVVPAGPARDMGLDRSMILGYGHDDRVCAYPSMLAQINVTNVERTSITLIVDKEEIGSVGATGMTSRFFENTVGRSRAFMGPLLEVLRRHAPEVYGDVDEDTLYHAVNIAQPSLIRTEADELTYPLHIMVRYQIERMLFAGEATAKDIPALWNRFMNEYLGIPVPDDTHGCLQDTHWSGGSFGYFPTYALGSAYDAMFVPAMCRDGVDLNGACASGDLAPVRAWLGGHIWQWGRAKDAPELIKGACGMAFDARYYCSYLQDKFTTLYQL